MFPHSNHEGHVSITTICEGIDWQVSHMTHLLSQFSVALSNVVHLNITNLSNLEGQLEGIDDVVTVAYLLSPNLMTFAPIRTAW